MARGARKGDHQPAVCVRKAQAPVPPLALDGHHVQGLHCMIHRIMSWPIPHPETGAHLGLSANEEVRTDISGSTGEGARLERAESLERTFDGPGCGGRTASLSPALDSRRFRCPSVPLPSSLRGCTTGGVTLRFSRCHELFIMIHNRGARQALYCAVG